MRKKQVRFLVIVAAVMLLAAILLVKLAHGANQGLSGGGTVWVGTEAGNCDSTGTDTRTAPMTVASILYVCTSSSARSVSFREGTNTTTLLKIYGTGTQQVSFGAGKTFWQGLYLNEITSGDTVFVFTK